MKTLTLVGLLVALLAGVTHASDIDGLMSAKFCAWKSPGAATHKILVCICNEDLVPTNHLDAMAMPLCISGTQPTEKVGIYRLIDTFMPKVDEGPVKYRQDFLPWQWQGGGFWQEKHLLLGEDSHTVLAYSWRVGTKTMVELPHIRFDQPGDGCLVGFRINWSPGYHHE